MCRERRVQHRRDQRFKRAAVTPDTIMKRRRFHRVAKSARAEFGLIGSTRPDHGARSGVHDRGWKRARGISVATTDRNSRQLFVLEVGPSLKEAELSSRFFPGFRQRSRATRPVTGEPAILLSSKGAGEPLRRRRRIDPAPASVRGDAMAEAVGRVPLSSPSGGVVATVRAHV